MNKNIPLGLLILRLNLGILMLMHGIAKVIKGAGAIQDKMQEAGIPSFFAYGVYLGEIIAPLLLIIGFRVRIAAVLYIGTMLVAIGLVHSGDIIGLTKSGGWAIELQALYLFGALVLFFTGGGDYSLSKTNKWD